MYTGKIPPLRNLGLLVKHVEPRTEKQSGKHTKKKLDVDRKEKKHNMNKKSIFKKKTQSERKTKVARCTCKKKTKTRQGRLYLSVLSCLCLPPFPAGFLSAHAQQHGGQISPVVPGG